MKLNELIAVVDLTEIYLEFESYVTGNDFKVIKVSLNNDYCFDHSERFNVIGISHYKKYTDHDLLITVMEDK